MAIINSAHLLQQAELLLKPRSKQLTIIRQAERRRAVPTAYYAVFHHILKSVADHFIGREERRSLRYALAYRAIDHGKFEALCNVVSRPRVEPKSRYAAHVPENGFDQALRDYATLLIDLKEKRNLSDYDPSVWIRLADARNSIAAASEAISKFDAAPENERFNFLTLLTFPPR